MTDISPDHNEVSPPYSKKQRRSPSMLLQVHRRAFLYLLMLSVVISYFSDLVITHCSELLQHYAFPLILNVPFEVLLILFVVSAR